MKIFFSPKCLNYHHPGHPESPERIRSVHDYLEARKYSFSEPHPCNKDDILRVHSEEHLKNLIQESFLDMDTPVLPDIAEFAMLSAGSAILAADSAIQGETAFSLMRPPGHHATRNQVMGFCYLNNIAIAVARHLESHPENRVAILDFDCHHGNGTEDIFLENPSVLYVSLHQTPLYPGTGLDSRSNAINFTLPPGTGETTYLEALDNAFAKISEFKPDLLAVSAGFDTFKEDPLTQIDLDIGTYKKIGNRISALNKTTFIVMEGGYSPKLPECVGDFLKGMEG